MAEALKCDICGGLFDKRHDTPSIIKIVERKPSSLIEQRSYGYDTCPCCSRRVIETLLELGKDGPYKKQLSELKDKCP